MSLSAPHTPAPPENTGAGSARPLPGGRAFVWFALALIPAVGVTALVTEAHRAEYRALAEDWRTAGVEAVRAGQPAGAVEAFRTALRFAREDRDLRLQLADALTAAGRSSEARAYLLGLWREQPGNGPVNLRLARLAAQAGQVEDAARYYQTAIQGAWEEDADRWRRDTRLEVAAMLVRHGRPARAEGELIPLAAEPPPDAETRHRLAALLADAGSHRRALELYQLILERQPRDDAALRGAGRAALNLGDHQTAAGYLRRVPDLADDPDLADRYETSRAYLAIDPYRRGLPARERAARVRRALQHAAARVEACGGREDLQPHADALREARRSGTPAALARDAERLDDAFAAALAAVHAARDCGEASALDRALLLLAERGPEVEP